MHRWPGAGVEKVDKASVPCSLELTSRRKKQRRRRLVENLSRFTLKNRSRRARHWGLRYWTFLLRYFGNFNSYCGFLRICGMRIFSILKSIINYSLGSPTLIISYVMLIIS